MRITTLIENHPADVQPELRAEHGLLLYVEQDNQRILFDAGATGALMQNAAQLGIDLAQADLVILSHHHYDHGGGLEAFFAVNDHAPVYLRPAPEGQPTFHALLVINRYIGLDERVLNRYRDRLIFLQNFEEVAPNVYLFAHIEHTNARPKGNKYIYLKQSGSLVHDPFDHELIMAVRDPDGLCPQRCVEHDPNGHGPIPPMTISRALWGGFHLVGLPIGKTMASSKAEMQVLAEEIEQLPVKRYWTGHCTGDKALGVLKGILGERLAGLRTGLVVDV